MSEENRTSTRQFVEIGDVHHSGESASEGEDNLQSQLLDRRLPSSEVDRGIDAIVAPLATQLVALIQSVRELSEESSNQSTEGNRASEQSRSSRQRSDSRYNLFFSRILYCTPRKVLYAKDVSQKVLVKYFR